MSAFEIEPGSAHPLGITTYPDGVNWSLFSQGATEVGLLLFDSAVAVEPTQTIRLDPFRNKTFHFWHVFVRGCGPGVFYAFRVDGPADSAAVREGREAAGPVRVWQRLPRREERAGGRASFSRPRQKPPV